MAGDDYRLIKLMVMGQVRSQFRPELINRIAEVVVFHARDEMYIKSIAKASPVGEALGLAGHGTGGRLTAHSPSASTTSWLSQNLQQLHLPLPLVFPYRASGLVRWPVPVRRRRTEGRLSSQRISSTASDPEETHRLSASSGS